MLLPKPFEKLEALLGYLHLPKPDFKCKTERFGTHYDGWHLAVEGLNHSSIVYSFGVGEDVSFDLALIRRFGLTVDAFDPTPKSLQWAREQRLPTNFILHPYGTADYDGSAVFYPPDNPDFISYSVMKSSSENLESITLPVKRLETIMQELGHARIDVLKMDIEGAEYQVISNIAQTVIRPSQLLVEFHHRFPKIGLSETRQAIRMLNRIGYKIFAVSDTGDEFCFIQSPSENT